MGTERKRNDAISLAPQKNKWNSRDYSKRYHEIFEKRMTLPVWRQKEKFLEAFRNKRTTIVVGETGSGKTTQIPQIVLDEINADLVDKKNMVACTLPQRAMVISASKRVAEEMDVRWGEEVGYCLPFEEYTSSNTVLKYLTDYMLLREVMTDPLLPQYKVIIIDEANERSLETDVLFGLLKEIIKQRQDLSVVVMSDNAEVLKKNYSGVLREDYFSDAKFVFVENTGSLHPVDIVYEPPVGHYLEAAINKALEIHCSVADSGDILIFLTGEEEIEDACGKLTKALGDAKDSVGSVKMVLYSTEVEVAMEEKIFAAPPTPSEGGKPVRKIFFSTNIPETSSLTSDGIAYVLDPGKAKQKSLRPNYAESLLVLPISKASAQRRSDCAKRTTQSGKCFRLYKESFFDDLEPQTLPEILRSNLTNTVFTLKITLDKLGITNLDNVDFIDPPAPETLSRALSVLRYFNAFGSGTCMFLSKFPLDLRMSRMLFGGLMEECADEMLNIASMLSVHNWFAGPTEALEFYKKKNGDHNMLEEVFRSFREKKEKGEHRVWCQKNNVNLRVMEAALNVYKNLVRIMDSLITRRKRGRCEYADSCVRIKQALLYGYFMQVARRVGNGDTYSTVLDKTFVELQFPLHPVSCLGNKPEWVVYNEVGSDGSFQIVSDILGDWLREFIPYYFSSSNFSNDEMLKKLFSRD